MHLHACWEGAMEQLQGGGAGPLLVMVVLDWMAALQSLKKAVRDLGNHEA